jgi:4-hydroxybenzoate polyprenyltransferase
VKAWLRLVRVSLAPSAAADPFAGLVYASAGFPADPAAYWLIPASLGVYHAALALNDWNDRDHDGRTRPGRPIPSGAVSPTLALVSGVALIAAGIACAYLAAPSSAVWMAVVAALAVLYDVAGRGAWLGPTLLALCRGGNMGSGVFWVVQAGTSPIEPAFAFLPAYVYGLYVWIVSKLGRLEDGEDGAPLGRRPSALLAWAGLALVCMPLAMGDTDLPARPYALALALAGAFALFRTADATRTWTRGHVERAMGLALRRLLVASAVVALLGWRPGSWDAPLAAAAILSGYPIAVGLRRAFPPS